MRGPYSAHQITGRNTREMADSCRGRACPARSYILYNIR
jgi:hypothetical protein